MMYGDNSHSMKKGMMTDKNMSGGMAGDNFKGKGSKGTKLTKGSPYCPPLSRLK